MTQQELGSQVGLSKAVVSKYETGMGYPTFDVLLRIAEFFGVTTDYLLGRTDIKLDINSLNEHVSSTLTKADVLKMMEQFSKEDCAYLVKTLRLLYYHNAKKDEKQKDI